MKIRTFEVLGFKIDLYRYFNKSYIYPQFNGNAEFECNKEGFKKLTHYLRNIIWIKNKMSSNEFEYLTWN